MNFTVLPNNSSALSDYTSSDFSYWNIIITILAVLIGSGSILALYFQDRITKVRSIQNKLREDRRKFYLELLDPYIFLFTNMHKLNQGNKTEVESKIYNEFLEKSTSYEYKQTAFKLCLLGSHEVIRAYNNLIEFSTLPIDQNQKDDNQIIVLLYATLLLKIRKDLGSKNTLLKRLSEKDMLKIMNINDANKLDIPKLRSRYRQIKYMQTKIK